MPWSGSPGSQIFSRTNGTNSGSNTWAQDSAGNIKITSLNHDTHDQDIASGISACLKRDGGNAMTASIPAGGNKFSNVGDAVALNQFASLKQVQNGTGIYVPTVGGTSNAITLTTGWSIAGYVAGQTFRFIAASTNSDVTTINVDGLGAKNVFIGGSGLTAGQIQASMFVEVTYDGTQFQLSVAPSVPTAVAVGTVMAWPLAVVPTGWLECDGSSQLRASYPSLFTVLGTSYGSADGTHFNLPNYKNQFLRGFDAAGTDAGSRTDRGDGTTGANVGTKQADDYLAHTHNLTGNTGAGGAHRHWIIANTAGGVALSSSNQLSTDGVYGGTASTGTATDCTIAQTSAESAHTHSLSGTTGTAPASGGNETRPKNVTVKWIILATATAALPAGTGFTRTAKLIHTGGLPAHATGDGTDTTPVVTETYIAEVFVPGPGSVSLTGVSLFNGSAVAGNIQVALADSNGNVVAQSAATAAAGTTAYQRIPFSAAYNAIGPATFYVLLQNNNTSNRYRSHTFGDFGCSKKTGETFGTFTAITPPTTFTAGQGPIASLY
jgi:microcystin-dependent protein